MGLCLFFHGDFPFAHFSKHFCSSPDTGPSQIFFPLSDIYINSPMYRFLTLVFDEAQPKIKSVNKQYLPNALQKSTYPFLPKSSKKLYQSDNAM